ncbi:hypothetical protein BOTBODRAFT_26293 [Botryobasidium botryosum FD-172 SS1]|uniref:Arrestin C-terminal-like domain-containing protein n=1 Tax=Botryobasidium botryosum (strain FD-172 SS1) TaxID=930990 RepID=A0A067N4L0_BOTB1|nr:hypothetical protein BOTBODRAFT_26293 [Botryobasidium botryosum FD-172 SS1]
MTSAVSSTTHRAPYSSAGDGPPLPVQMDGLSYRPALPSPTPAPQTADMGSSSTPSQSPLEIVLADDTLICRSVGGSTEPALLAGHLVLNLHESTNIKEVTLQLTARIRIPLSDADRSPITIGATHRTQVLFAHNWSFLQGDKSHKHTLKAGQHVFPFQYELDGTLPASITCASTDVSWKLRATAVRSAFSSNYHAVRPLTVIRALSLDSLEFNQTLEIENSWTGKIMYSIMLPHKAYAAGDDIPVLVRFSPLLKGVHVLSISTQLKEYSAVKLPATQGFIPEASNRTIATSRHYIRDKTTIDSSESLSSASNSAAGPSTSRISPPNPAPSVVGSSSAGPSTAEDGSILEEDHISRISSMPLGDGEVEAAFKVPIPVTTTPSQAQVATSAAAPTPIVVVHKIKFVVTLSNPDGHLSELRCSLPLHILHHRLLEEAKQASHATRSLLFGTDTTADHESEHVELPSYQSHVHDRVPVAITTPYPHGAWDSALPALEVSAYSSPDSSIPNTPPSGVSPLAMGRPTANRMPSIPDFPTPGSSYRSSPLSSPDVRSSMLSGPYVDLGAELIQSLRLASDARPGPSSSRGMTPPDSRHQSRVGSRAPSPDRDNRSSDSHSTQSHTSDRVRSTGLFHLPHIKPFTSFTRHGHSKSSGGLLSVAQQQLQQHQQQQQQQQQSTSSSRAASTGSTSPRVSSSLEVEDLGSMSDLNRVPSYGRSALGFLGGGPTPLGLYRDLPSYDEAERVRESASAE